MYTSEELRGVGRTTGYVFEVIGWCLTNPNHKCYIGKRDENFLINFSKIPKIFIDHAAWEIGHTRRLAELLYKMVQEIVLYNNLKGFVFNDKELSIEYKLELRLKEETEK